MSHAHPPHEHDHPHHDGRDHHRHGNHDHAVDDHQHQTGIRGFLAGLFLPHSHDASDKVDSELETSQDGIRALKLSLAGLTITAAIQLVVVVISGSVALFADTIHNGADALTAIPLWVAFRLGRRPATNRYTYGYGRAEDLAGVFVVALIALSSVVAGYEAISRLLHPHGVRNVGWVIVAGVVGFAGNELVATYRIRVGRRIGSAALVADGLHARTDGLTSLGVVLGGFGVLAGFQQADPLIGLLITVAILLVLKSAAVEIYRRLMDGVDPSMVESVRAALLKVPGVDGVDTVRVRWVGHRLRAEVELLSDPSLTLVDAHAIAEDAHHQLLHSVPRLWQAVIHTSPSPGGDDDYHHETAHHFQDNL